MVGFLLFGAVFTLLILIGGTVAWRHTTKLADKSSARRTRSEAREIQTRFEADTDFARNFQRPTQNEVLETLQMLDYISPGWDREDVALIDHQLKNELAESFPTLRKAGCVYPRNTAAGSVRGLGKAERKQATHTALARQKFRAARAQANAFHQLTSGMEEGPAEVTPGSLPFRSPESPDKRTNGGWKEVALAVMTLALAAGGWYFAVKHRREGKMVVPVLATGQTDVVIHPEPVGSVPQEATPTLPAAATPAIATVEATAPSPPPPPTPSISPALADATTPEVRAQVPAPSPPVDPAGIAAKADTSFAEGVAASKERAVDKYPDLTLPNSEINLRFVFRYKVLLAEKSARLQDSHWPEELADECAKATNGSPRTKRITPTASREH